MSEIKIDDLRNLCLRALTKTGLSNEHAQITVDHYLENELSGKTSHGMVRVVEAAKTIRKYGLPDKQPEIIHDKGDIAIFDGYQNLAPVVCQVAVNESIKRAKEHGISLVGAQHYITNSGSMAYYLRQLAEKNVVSILSCNSVPLVCPPNGKDRILGTNPIGLGVPSSDGHHFIADFATSAIAYGKILVANDKNEKIPEGLIIDKNGKPSNNPKDMIDGGATKPLADYRGFALGLFIELLAAFVGGQVIDKKDDFSNQDWYGKDGFFIISIDAGSSSVKNFSDHVTSILNYVRNSEKIGSEAVTLPGDRSAKTLKETLERGSVDVTDKTLHNIQELAA